MGLVREVSYAISFETAGGPRSESKSMGLRTSLPARLKLWM